jgi:hypothetical protein
MFYLFDPIRANVTKFKEKGLSGMLQSLNDVQGSRAVKSFNPR